MNGAEQAVRLPSLARTLGPLLVVEGEEKPSRLMTIISGLAVILGTGILFLVSAMFVLSRVLMKVASKPGSPLMLLAVLILFGVVVAILGRRAGRHRPVLDDRLNAPTNVFTMALDIIVQTAAVIMNSDDGDGGSQNLPAAAVLVTLGENPSGIATDEPWRPLVRRHLPACPDEATLKNALRLLMLKNLAMEKNVVDRQGGFHFVALLTPSGQQMLRRFQFLD